MNLTNGQHENAGISKPVYNCVDFSGSFSTTNTNRLLWALSAFPFLPCTGSVCLDIRSIYAQILHICAFTQLVKQSFQFPIFLLLRKPLVHSLPRPIIFRQILPRRTDSQNPENSVKQISVISLRSPHSFGLIPKVRLDDSSLFICSGGKRSTKGDRAQPFTRDCQV